MDLRGRGVWNKSRRVVMDLRGRGVWNTSRRAVIVTAGE